MITSTAAVCLSILWQNRSTGGLLSISRQIRRKKSESGSAWPNRRERIHHGKKQGKDAAEIYVQQGRQDLADAELAQVKVMEAYLPKQMTPEELEAALKEIIAETGATSGKDMGKVMGVASKKLAGLAEGRAISAKVKELLG